MWFVQWFWGVSGLPSAMLKDPRLLWPCLVALSLWNCSLQHDVNRAYRLADHAESQSQRALDKLFHLRVDEIYRETR